MRSDVVAGFLPSLAARVEPEFNLFEVLHHGSNLFGWLLNSEGTHKLGDAFARIFVEEVNRGLKGHRQIGFEPLSVSQEVDTSGNGADIADIVLEGVGTILVVENYYTSDGHGHSYFGYLSFGEQTRKTCVVVLLCESVNPESQRDGWECAPVVTYRTLVTRLLSHVEADPKYQKECAEQYSFFRHMERQFVKGIQVNTEQLIDFIDAMCQVGESDRLSLGGDDAALKFADNFRELAVTNFNESRGLLFEVKRILKDYSSRVLREQVNEALTEERFGKINANYAGRWQWTVNIDPHEPAENTGGEKHPDGGDLGRLQLKFGPSAQLANAGNETWLKTVPAPNYAHVFITWNREVRQSAVTLLEVVRGLDDYDVRLRDEIVEFIKNSE
jgi:hypothetical protein